MSFEIIEGEAYFINWTDFWSSEGFVWTLEEDGVAITPTDLIAAGGIEQVHLNWNPFNPANLDIRTESNISGDIARMNAEEHVQYRNQKMENASMDNPNAWQGKTLEQLQDHVASLSLPRKP